MVEFSKHQDALETAVDQMYGEAVVFRQYQTGGYQSSPSVDGSRPVTTAIGYVTSRGSAMRPAGGATVISRRLEADYLLRVLSKYLVNVKEHDRVEFPETRQGEVFEISYIEPSANGRPILHLMRVRE